MKTIRFHSNLLLRLGLIFALGLSGSACSQDETAADEPYVRFGEEIREISYDLSLIHI